MNCPKCDTPMKDMGEVQMQGRAEIFPMLCLHNHVMNMWVCPKCQYVDLYYKKRKLSI